MAMHHVRRSLAVFSGPLVAIGFIAGIGGAAAQASLSYAIVQDNHGNVVTALAGNGASIDGQPTAIITCPDNATFSTNGCANGKQATSVVGAPSVPTAATVPNAASRTPNIVCKNKLMAPTLIGGKWVCRIPPGVKSGLAY